MRCTIHDKLHFMLEEVLGKKAGKKADKTEWQKLKWKNFRQQAKHTKVYCDQLLAYLLFKHSPTEFFSCITILQNESHIKFSDSNTIIPFETKVLAADVH